MPQVIGAGSEFHFPGHGFDLFKFPQTDLVPDGGDYRIGLAPGLHQRHKFGDEILGQGYGSSVHDISP
jgi:hypothetical protein